MDSETTPAWVCVHHGVGTHNVESLIRTLTHLNESTGIFPGKKMSSG